MPSLKLVINTNVLISAALSPSGVPAQLLRLALEHHRIVFSQPTFDELRTRLYRPKFDRYIDIRQRERLLHDFNACAYWVTIGEPARYSRDPDDDKFITTALESEASYLVSGDMDLLELSASAPVRIVTPRQVQEVLAGHSS